MSEVQKLDPLPNGKRPETGPMQFGDDWPGVFIRGDDALFYAAGVAAAVDLLPAEQWALKSQLKGLVSDLVSCSVGDTGWPPSRSIQRRLAVQRGEPLPDFSDDET